MSAALPSSAQSSTSKQEILPMAIPIDPQMQPILVNNQYPQHPQILEPSHRLRMVRHNRQNPLRLIVDGKTIGPLFGVNGNTITEIRRESKTRIDIPGSDVVRVISIFGAVECIIQASLMIADRLSTKLTAFPTYSITFLVHESQVGRIIGFNGNFIKRTRAQTNATIFISNNALSGTEEKTCFISSSEKRSFDHAVATVINQLRSKVQDAYRTLSNLYIAPPPAKMHYYRLFNREYNLQSNQEKGKEIEPTPMVPALIPPSTKTPLDSNGDEFTVICNLYVPKWKIGCVIGKHGSNIKYIKFKTQCEVQTTRISSELEENQLIRIIGCKRDIPKALGEIETALVRADTLRRDEVNSLTTILGASTKL